MRRFLIVPVFLLLVGCSASTASPSATESIPNQVPPTTESVPTETMTATATESMQSVQTLPDASGYRWTKVVAGLIRPLDLQNAGDGRIFIVEQRGVIWIMADGTLLGEPFLDIRGRVSRDANERGLLGLAFAPDFQETGEFYVDYTDNSGNTVIAGFSVSGDPNIADPSSERLILGIEQPYKNHNGGGIVFGPDGYLYIGTGDGGSGGDPQRNAQNLDSLLGKMLRIDVLGGDPYAIPPDNPFLDGGRAEIWAYGLRNPWRFAFDRVSGDLYIADVGQGTYEEVDFWPAGSPSGVNYGWNIREGMHPFKGQTGEGLTDPVAEYDHTLGCSITGGVVVHDPALPEWNGVYLYGDYCTGLIWGVLRNADGNWVNDILFRDTGYVISAFGEDVNGGVYLVDHTGVVYHLEHTSGN